MSICYTKQEAIDKLLEGDPMESILRIQGEREGRKYCLVTAYTPYAGEELEAYLSYCKEEDLFAFLDDISAECANEWIDQHLDSWEEDGYDSYEDAQEDYYSGCGTRVHEVPKEEYAKATEAYWYMRK